MASRMLSTAIRPAAGFAVSRQAVATARSFSGSTMSLKHKETIGESHRPTRSNPIQSNPIQSISYPLLPLPLDLANPSILGSIGENDDPEKHKQDLLAKQKAGKGHWKPELASDSEEAVKADRAADKKEDMTTLQNRTKALAEETAKTGTSMRDGL
ncbi:hypothetical protein F4861DRAFT_444610 [Xylaria intraflava]|nr:hypothetical protein F4861DRAFT_444610 [Xylaria intraflava]